MKKLRVIKKNPYDKTSTERSRRLAGGIKAAGGGSVNVRFKTAAELQQVDDLVDAGVGADRSEVIRKLIRKRHERLIRKG